MVDHLRALFILLHVAAIAALCIPAPVGGLNARTYNDRNIQQSFEDYAALAQAVGIDIDRKGLQDLAWARGQDLIDLRLAAIQPFERYYALTGTRQGWRMFGYVNRSPARIEVYLQQAAEGPWEPLYVARSDTHDWRRHQLDQERFRGLLNSASHGRSRGRYKRFVSWFARQAAADFPDAHALRVQMVKLPSPTPARLRELGEVPVGKTFWQTDVVLGADPEGGGAP